MSQQEFEPRERGSSYNRSRQSAEGIPRDESPGSSYGASQPFGQSNDQDYQSRTSRVPWWARPQLQPNASRTLAAFGVLVIVILVLMGVLGIMGLILGALLHLLGFILAALFALFIFALLLVLFLVGMIGRAFSRATGYNRRAARRGGRRW